jgi:hypothetical protein
LLDIGKDGGAAGNAQHRRDDLAGIYFRFGDFLLDIEAQAEMPGFALFSLFFGDSDRDDVAIFENAADSIDLSRFERIQRFRLGPLGVANEIESLDQLFRGVVLRHVRTMGSEGSER